MVGNRHAWMRRKTIFRLICTVTNKSNVKHDILAGYLLWGQRKRRGSCIVARLQRFTFMYRAYILSDSYVINKNKTNSTRYWKKIHVKLRLRRYIIKYTAAPSSHRIISAVGHCQCLPQRRRWVAGSHGSREMIGWCKKNYSLERPVQSGDLSSSSYKFP